MQRRILYCVSGFPGLQKISPADLQSSEAPQKFYGTTALMNKMSQ